jgi:regulator of sirC expression with transglutaminase-like and TPR domain
MSRAYEPLAALVERHGDGIPLDLGMLALARVEHPDLDEDRWLGALDDLADSALGAEPAAANLSGAVVETVFGAARFRGAADVHGDPRGSLLPDVLERRIGLPISLAVVYLEVARRAGSPARGIGFPGHFLVEDLGRSAPVLLDPFDGGAELDRKACERLLGRVSGGRHRRVERWMLAPASPKDILARVLTNLKGAYLSRKDAAGAVQAIDRILIVDPARVSERRDRGLLLAQLGFPAAGRADLEAYLAASPGAAAADEARALMTSLTARARAPS